MITAFTVTGLMISDSAEANPYMKSNPYAVGGYNVYNKQYQLQSQIRPSTTITGSFNGYDVYNKQYQLQSQIRPSTTITGRPNGYDVYNNKYQLQSQIRPAPSFGYDW